MSGRRDGSKSHVPGGTSRIGGGAGKERSHTDWSCKATCCALTADCKEPSFCSTVSASLVRLLTTIPSMLHLVREDS